MLPALLPAYRATRWSGLPRTGGAVAIVGAWNPGSRRLSAAANAARDARLRRLLPPGARRVRGSSPDGAWYEDMWLIAHRPRRTGELLRRFAQHAAAVREGGRWRLRWRSGACQPLTFAR